MGIRDLSRCIERYARGATRPIRVRDVRGKRFAVDANIFMYRFMAAKPIYEGRHVERFRRFVDWMRLHGIEPIFVFDGDSPEEKMRELKARREQKKKATTHLRDLQQGVVVLQHLDWRWWQLTVVLRAIALIQSPQLQPPLPVTVQETEAKEGEDTAASSSREIVPEEPNLALGALFQLLAETLEWGTETYLPNRLVQNLVDKSFLVHELPRDQLPPLIRFVAQIRLRRHTPHMVELDWMHDPAEAVMATESCTGTACASPPATYAAAVKQGGGRPPPVIIGGDLPYDSPSHPQYLGNDGDSNNNNKGTDGDDGDGVERSCNCATAFACRAMTSDVLETLLLESLNKHTKSKDIFRPFLVCIHCTRDVSRRLYPLVRRYRRRLDAAWNNPSDYTFLVAVVAHDGPEKEGEWLLPSQTRAQKFINRWQETLPWPTKKQEKAAKGANFDYYDWICSARSSEWWYEMRDQCTAAAKETNSEDNEEKDRCDGESVAWDDEMLDGDALSTSKWSLTTDWLRKGARRNVCRYECDLYTCAAATLTNRGPEITTSKAVKKRSKHTASLEKEWDRFRTEQQKKRLEALESVQSEWTEETQEEEEEETGAAAAAAERDDRKYEDGGEAENEEKPTSVVPTKQRLQCLESPEQRTMLVQQMRQQIASLEPQVTRVTGEQLEEVHTLLRSMGTLVLTAEHEAEATCARLCRAGYADWVVTEDFDAMPFGAPLMLRRLLWTTAVLDGEDAENPEASEKVQCLPDHTQVGELIDFDTAMAALQMSAREFVDLCILCGCDFCKGIHGIGYVTARDLIHRHGSLENIVRRLDARGRYAKGLRQFNLENAVKARKLFMDNHTDVLPDVVCEQLQLDVTTR